MTNWVTKLGYIKDVPDARDYSVRDLFSAIKLDFTENVSVSLREDQSDVSTQLYSNCVGHAVVNGLEFLSNKSKKQFYDLSPMFVYWCAREAVGTQDKDEGCSIRIAIQETKKGGSARLEFCKEEKINLYEKPYLAAWINAEMNQTLNYYRVNGLNELIQSLSAGFPVVGGFNVYQSISKTGKDGIVLAPTTGDVILGGHAVLFCGVDMEKQLVLFKNSWGKSFGDEGYGWLPFSYWVKDVHDCWVISEREYETEVTPKEDSWIVKVWKWICRLFGKK
jgi:hypothetical protein